MPHSVQWITSKVICYVLEFQQALRAAIKVAGKKDLATVRLQLCPEEEELRVFAMDTKATIEIRVPTIMCDLADKDRDEIIEISTVRAQELASMKIKRDDSDDDEPKAGLIISESWIQATDETGLGIGVRHTRVPRLRQLRLPGDPARSIDRALHGEFEQDGLIDPSQMKLAAAVAQIMCMQTQLRHLSIEPPATRILLLGHRFALTVIAGSAASREPSERESAEIIDEVLDLEPHKVAALPPGGVA